jgi:hypothetical protein
MYLEKTQQRARDLYRLTGKQPVPCTISEVEELEQWIGHSLPEAYREFLLWMGHAGGGLLEGSDCFSQHVRDLPSLARDLLEEDQCGNCFQKMLSYFLCIKDINSTFST